MNQEQSELKWGRTIDQKWSQCKRRLVCLSHNCNSNFTRAYDRYTPFLWAVSHQHTITIPMQQDSKSMLDSRNQHGIRQFCWNQDLADGQTERCISFSLPSSTKVCTEYHGTTPKKQERPLLEMQELVKLWGIYICVCVCIYILAVVRILFWPWTECSYNIKR
jgi:hypothetical protein